MMHSKINIVTVVDVIGALSDTALDGNLYMMDDSSWQSIKQGTANLSTLCHPGQLIHWVVYALDLQTPVAIRNITFISPDASGGVQHRVAGPGAESDKLHLNVWSGIVPYHMIPGVEYRYRLELQMYEGKNSIMYVDTPSLRRI
jgi:hypothetical protein